MLRPLVPTSDPITAVKPQAFSCCTRAMMTNKINRINLRKDLRPNDRRDFVKDRILSLNLRGHHAELSLYFDKVSSSERITLLTTRDL
jgi:hypothetical protein